jgi:hypothetical protein
VKPKRETQKCGGQNGIYEIMSKYPWMDRERNEII